MNENDGMEGSAEIRADLRLQQLLHLKRYEVPDSSRVARNKQNIMRRVREAESRRRWSLGDLLEMNIPWFFAEPRYGIAALFIAFAGLQFLGVNARRHHVQQKAGIYSAAPRVTRYKPETPAYTNQVVYPELPSNIALFPDRQYDSGVQFVGRVEVRK